MNIAVARRKVQIETSDNNLQRLSNLFKTIQLGGIEGKVVRPPMRVEDIAKCIGVSRKTFYEWRDGASMPQPGNLRSIAKNLLKVKEQDLSDYLTGVISLRDLLSIKPKASTPDEVYNIFHSLDEREKDTVLALLLRDRALEVGNFSSQKNSKRFHAVSSTTNVLDGEDRLMASSIGEGLSPHMAKRLRILLIASQEKHSRIANENLDLDEIAERQGVHLGTYSILAVEAAAEGTIGETYGHRLFTPEWNAMAVICFEPTGWRGDQLVGLTNRTFKDRVETFKRSLSENGNPNRV
jgi:transcriptional regulator with XRE-family HTH domain